MSVLRDPRNHGKVLLVGGLVATVVVHGGLIGAFLIGRARAATRSEKGPLIGTVVEVQAVKFGKPRDMSFLPHKEAPPPPREKPKLVLTQNDRALPKLPDPIKKDSPLVPDDPLKRTRAQQFKDLADPENTGTVEDVGDPNGLRGGTATVGKGPIYLQKLVAAVGNAWVVPTTISEARLARLSAQACIKIDATGKIVEYKLFKTSGDEAFDATLLNALGAIGQLEPPTDDVKDVVTGDGVCINFRKDRGEK